MNIGEISLEELMGEDYYVFLRLNPKFGVDMTLISDEVDEDVVTTAVHPAAIESMATFCRRFLKQYEELGE